MRLSALVLVVLGLSSTTLAKREGIGAAEVRAIMASTVQIHAQIKGTVTSHDAKGEEIEQEVDLGWAGSGVVYAKTEGKTGPVHSKILTANHVLESPAKVGDTVESNKGSVHIDSVKFDILTNDGRTCSLEPLVLGSSDTKDAATGDADCDAGRVAVIADEAPEVGSKVYVSGHPLGFPKVVITEGFVGDYWEGFLLVAAPAAPGNSGGPVFYNGKVIGLLVRGSRSYEELSLVTTLEVVQARIAETP